MCLSGCAGLGRETPAAPASATSDSGAACDPPQPAERPLAQVISRWRDRVDRCAERVRDDIDRVGTAVPNFVEKAADADVTQCLLPPLCIVGYFAAFFAGHGAPAPCIGCGSSSS
jgi:hypothetical protein